MSRRGQRFPRSLPSSGKRAFRILVIAALFALTAPAVAFAAGGFSDVTAGNTHLDGITYVSQHGIAQGFDDGTYRSLASVTRGQMATFLYRASGNDPGTPPSVNATELDGLDAGELVAAGAQVKLDQSDQPYIADWFNNINGVEPTVAVSMAGTLVVNVGFGTGDAQFQVTIDRTDPDTRDAFATVGEGGQDEVYIDVYDVSVGGPAPAEFYLLVYGE